MKTTEQGKLAEVAAAQALKGQGFKIVGQNWRRPLAEIDLVAQKDGTLYFVEVKYRSSEFQGDGFEYVTAAKQKQMQFAASLWIQENNYDGDYQLMAASVSGDNCENIQIVEA